MYAWSVNFKNIPVFAPFPPYTPLYSNLSYDSNLRLEPNTPNQDVYRGFNRAKSDPTAQGWTSEPTVNNAYYKPDLVGRQSAYERTLFLMNRDMAVLNERSEMPVFFYCVWNEDPVESVLSESAFKIEFNFATVFPCTGPLHDAHVPMCICPVPISPVAPHIFTLSERIKAHRAAAPFATRLRDLYAAVADAHWAAKTLEPSDRGVRYRLTVNVTFEPQRAEKEKPGFGSGLDPSKASAQHNLLPPPHVSISETNQRERNAEKLKAAKERNRVARELKHAKFKLAAEARAVADDAEAELATFIKSNEDAAFALFEPEVRSILTTARTNTINGYVDSSYFLDLDDLISTPSNANGGGDGGKNDNSKTSGSTDDGNSWFDTGETEIDDDDDVWPAFI